MSIEQRTRALMIRHQNLQQNRERCVLSRAAAEMGLPNEEVRFENKGKAHVNVLGLDDGPRVGAS
ncbi:hypothetical protein [Alkalinema sp. FACHB-956]|uniref:hypothetical protein n=1 Tax=Alkalinema sp. FACHB-956 TaxID=2692768 RepID=UPI001684A8BB|nr:hypothetical protein [Alkalinema sp. FACHB-956]MBD2326552.1 hypothetical protein [Alkalinema sp. FACHB-956]